MKSKVLIVEDHPLFRAGIVQLLKTDRDLEIYGESDSRSGALEFLNNHDRPDLVLLDLTLKDSGGMELLKDIRYRYPGLPILVLSMHDEQYHAERVLNAGGRGYIMKQEGAQSILEGIRTVLDGEIFISRQIKERLENKSDSQTNPGDRIRTLSDREMEIFELTSQGFGTNKIADQLNLSVKTIETHKAHIKQKLSLASSAELRRFAIEWRNSLG